MSESNNQSTGDLFPYPFPASANLSPASRTTAPESLATVRRVPNEPGMAAKVFTMVAEAGVKKDMIVQASASTGTLRHLLHLLLGTAAAKVRPSACRRSRASWTLPGPSRSTRTSARWPWSAWA